MVSVTMAEGVGVILLLVRRQPAALKIDLEDAVASPPAAHIALSFDLLSSFQRHDPCLLAALHANGRDADGIIGIVVDPSLMGQSSLLGLLVEDRVDGLADLVGPGQTFHGSEEMLLQAQHTCKGVFFVVFVGSERTECSGSQNANLSIPLLSYGIVLGLGGVQLLVHAAG